MGVLASKRKKEKRSYLLYGGGMGRKILLCLKCDIQYLTFCPFSKIILLRRHSKDANSVHIFFYPFELESRNFSPPLKTILSPCND